MAQVVLRVLLVLLFLFWGRAEELEVSTNLEVSYVIEPFESSNESLWFRGVHNNGGNLNLNVTKEDALFGEHALRVEYSLDFDEASDAWSGHVEFGEIELNRPHICHGAMYLSIWYKLVQPPSPPPSGGRLKLALVLLDDSVCTKSQENCTLAPGTNLENYYSFHYLLDDTVDSESINDWQEWRIPVGFSGISEETFVQLNSGDKKELDLSHLRGWRIELSLEEDSDHDGNIISSSSSGIILFDQLACIGGGDLFGAGFYAGNNWTDAVLHGGWTEQYFQSQVAEEQTSVVMEDGVLGFNYTVQQVEVWGGFNGFTYGAPGNAYYNLSQATHVKFEYIVAEAQSPPGRAHVRLILLDASDDISDFDDIHSTYEMWYSFNYFLDGGQDDNVLALEGNTEQIEDFWLTGWTGVWGNRQLDVSMLKGYTIEFNVDSQGELFSTVSGAIFMNGLTGAVVIEPPSASPSITSTPSVASSSSPSVASTSPSVALPLSPPLVATSSSPSVVSSSSPSAVSLSSPSVVSSFSPSVLSSFSPSVLSSLSPSGLISSLPSSPSEATSSSPTGSASSSPSVTRSSSPSVASSSSHSMMGSFSPSVTGTSFASMTGLSSPSVSRSSSPSVAVSSSPSTMAITLSPSMAASSSPSVTTSSSPSFVVAVSSSSPVVVPSSSSVAAFSSSFEAAENSFPSVMASQFPSMMSSQSPSVMSSQSPSVMASQSPSVTTSSPSLVASSSPSLATSSSPTVVKSLSPSVVVPSSPFVGSPTTFPSETGSLSPSEVRSLSPSVTRSLSPSVTGSSFPSLTGSSFPSLAVSSSPSLAPSSKPSLVASSMPSLASLSGSSSSSSSVVTLSPSMSTSSTPSVVIASTTPSLVPSSSPSAVVWTTTSTTSSTPSVVTPPSAVSPLSTQSIVGSSSSASSIGSSWILLVVWIAIII